MFAHTCVFDRRGILWLCLHTSEWWVGFSCRIQAFLHHFSLRWLWNSTRRWGWDCQGTSICFPDREYILKGIVLMQNTYSLSCISLNYFIELFLIDFHLGFIFLT